jgi:hypothetical protein
MHRLTFITLAALTAVAPAVASASTHLDVRIPASACRPNAASRAKIKLQNGSWVYNSGQSGTAVLFCPVHIARPKDLEDSPQILSMRMWYRDPDGGVAPIKSRVTARLMRREFDDAIDTAITNGFITSESFPATVYGREWVQVYHTADYLNFSYHVEVEMYRRLTTDTAPVFVGLDFTTGPS